MNAEAYLKNEWRVVQHFNDREGMEDFIASPTLEFVDYTMLECLQDRKPRKISGFMLSNQFVDLSVNSELYKRFPFHSDYESWNHFWLKSKDSNKMTVACQDLISRDKKMLITMLATAENVRGQVPLIDLLRAMAKHLV